MEYILMNASHIEAIAKLEKQCFSDPWSLNAISSELKNPLSLWIVAVDGEKIAGYVGSQTVLGWSDMMNLAVAPEYRRNGIGQTLVMELIRHLQEDQKATCLTLEVRASNMPAIELYSKLGFQEVGRRPGYYFKPKEDAIILRKDWEL